MASYAATQVQDLRRERDRLLRQVAELEARLLEMGRAGICRCGHPEGEHLAMPGVGRKSGDDATGPCAIHRADGGPECGCQRFEEAAS